MIVICILHSFVWEIRTAFSSETTNFGWMMMNEKQVDHFAPQLSAIQEDEEQNMKYILFFNPFWKHRDYKFGFGSDGFRRFNCPQPNCFTTDNRTLLGDDPSHFDAVVFSGMHFRLDQPAKQFIDSWRRPHRQRFVYYQMESPDYDWNTYDAKAYNNFFNWTMTYRHDSDILRLYGWFQKKDEVRVAPQILRDVSEWPKQYQPRAPIQITPELQRLAKRPKKVAWIVSHCNVSSKREMYVEQLQKYVDVDIFGACSDNNQTCDDPQKGHLGTDNCTLAIGRDYKFYLSLENAFADDYVTEKFFQRVQQSHVVPIVLGQANYSTIAPPHSYIDVLDFPSPRNLAKYILELDRDDDAYLSYFWWKDEYRVIAGDEALGSSFCDLCAKLHDRDQSSTSPLKSYRNFERWWREDAHVDRVLQERFQYILGWNRSMAETQPAHFVRAPKMRRGFDENENRQNEKT